MNLVYGEMLGSALMHAAAPIVILSIAGNLMPNLQPSTFVIMLLVIVPIASIVMQTILLATLQQSSCNGIKSYLTIGAGAVAATLITVGMLAIPLYVESMRLMVPSAIGFVHQTVMTPDKEENTRGIQEASVKLFQTGGALKQEEFDSQTLFEMTAGASYWLLFAGAYGVGVGSYFSSVVCPPT